MTEDIITQKIGLTDAEATDLVKKHSRYLESLTPPQYKLVKASLPSWEQAASALGHGVTAQDLLNYVKARGGAANQEGALCICVALPRPIEPPRPSGDED